MASGKTSKRFPPVLAKSLRRAAVYKKLLTNISWLAASSLFVKPFWFIFITLICVRELGDEGYGIFTAAFSLANLSSFITDLGTIRYSTRAIAQENARASSFFSNILVTRFALSGLSLGIAFVSSLLLSFSTPQTTALLFACLYVLTQNILNFCRAMLQAFELLKIESVFLIIEKCLVILGGIWLLYSFGSPAATLAGMATGIIITAFFIIRWISRRVAPFNTNLLSFQFTKDVLTASIPLGIAGIFSMLYFRIDALVIDYFQGEAATGHYGLPFRILEASILLPTVVVAAIFPRLSSLWHKGEIAVFKRLALVGTGGVFIGATLVGLIFYFFSEPIILFLADSDDFFPSYEVFRILSMTFPFLALHQLLYALLTAVEKERFLSWATGIAFLLNLILNILLVPQYGIIGASWTTLATAAFLALLMVIRISLTYSSKS